MIQLLFLSSYSIVYLLFMCTAGHILVACYKKQAEERNASHGWQEAGGGAQRVAMVTNGRKTVFKMLHWLKSKRIHFFRFVKDQDHVKCG